MLSHELKKIHVFLQLCRGRGGAGAGHIDAVLNALASCHADALALEASAVPRGQKMTAAQWADPKIAVFPLVPRNEAFNR